MPGKGEARLVEMRLRDGVSDDRARLPTLHERHGALDRTLHRDHCGDGRPAGDNGTRDIDRQERERLLEDGRRLCGGRHGGDRHGKAQRIGALRENSLIAKNDERRNRLLASRSVSEKRYVGPDPGRIAKGEGQGEFGRRHRPTA